LHNFPDDRVIFHNQDCRARAHDFCYLFNSELLSVVETPGLD
jgi:hypothetical protein